MHELSIAQRIVETVEGVLIEDAGSGPPASLMAVNVRVGALSGVIPQALTFAWDVATDGTLLEGSSIQIDAVPVVVHCPTCDVECELPGIQKMKCPNCGTPTPRVLRGRELEILSLELSDEATDTTNARGTHGDQEEERCAGACAT